MSLIYVRKPVYKESFILNKNIAIAFAVSITISALVAEALSDQEAHLNTTYTVLVDYALFFSTFGILNYFDNRKKYRLESGKTDTVLLRQDLVKLLTSLGIAEVVYNIVRWILQYQLLIIEFDAYMASIASQMVAMVVYLLVMNLVMKMKRFSKRNGRTSVKNVHEVDRTEFVKKKPTHIKTETMIHPIEELPTEALYLTYNKLLDMYNETLDQKMRSQLVLISEILQKRRNAE